jgi:hypothetical protein
MQFVVNTSHRNTIIAVDPPVDSDGPTMIPTIRDWGCRKDKDKDKDQEKQRQRLHKAIAQGAGQLPVA